MNLPNFTYVGDRGWREGVNASVTIQGDGYTFRALLATNGAILAHHRDRRPRDWTTR